VTVHSFGGSALDRHIFDFEVDPGAGEPGLLGDPAAGEPGGEAEPWSLSQDDFAQLGSRFDQLAETVEQLARLEAARAQPYLQQQPQGGGEVPLPDPWNRPDSYEDDLRAWGESLVQPFQQRFETLDHQDGQERLTDVLTDLEGEKGEFLAPTRDDMYALATAKARELYPQFAARMGNGDPAAEAAMGAAFDYAKGVEKKLVEAAIARHTNEIAELAGAPRPPGSSYSEGLQVRAVPDWRTDNRTIAEKLMAEQAGR
jgi:hypothetical protein